jgi:hypothetical protein
MPPAIKNDRWRCSRISANPLEVLKDGSVDHCAAAKAQFVQIFNAAA